MADGAIEVNAANISGEKAAEFLQTGKKPNEVSNKKSLIEKIKNLFKKSGQSTGDAKLDQAVDYLQGKEGATLPKEYEPARVVPESPTNAA